MRILVSDSNEAGRRAREAFETDPDLEFVVAEGNATMGGVTMHYREGILVMCHNGKGAWAKSEAHVEEVKQELIKGGA